MSTLEDLMHTERDYLETRAIVEGLIIVQNTYAKANLALDNQFAKLNYVEDNYIQLAKNNGYEIPKNYLFERK